MTTEEASVALFDEVKRLREQLAEAKRWKEGDSRMWREQLRVSDEAYNFLHAENKSLLARSKTLRDALVAIVGEGGETAADLRKMYVLIYRSNASHDTKARSIQAIRALLATMP